MTAFDWAAALGGGLLLWLALALAVGLPFGRMIRAADDREFTDWTLSTPPVPDAERAA